MATRVKPGEKIVDGVLCARDRGPDGWVSFSLMTDPGFQPVTILVHPQLVKEDGCWKNGEWIEIRRGRKV